MKNLIKMQKSHLFYAIILTFLIGLLAGTMLLGALQDSGLASEEDMPHPQGQNINYEYTTSTFGIFQGDVPMEIYTVYDKETGVYYAVTEQGGICVMQTQTGYTKLVDQGEGEVVHHNQGY